MMDKLSGTALADQLATLPRWQFDASRGAIQREFLFADFNQAFGFMTQVALVADKRDHHPEWSNVHHRVTILLTTHDADGLTQKDIDLARFADEAAARFGL